jgi:hypothetical protein
MIKSESYSLSEGFGDRLFAGMVPFDVGANLSISLEAPGTSISDAVGVVAEDVVAPESAVPPSGDGEVTAPTSETQDSGTTDTTTGSFNTAPIGDLSGLPASGDVSAPVQTDDGSTVTPNDTSTETGTLPSLQSPPDLQGLPDPSVPTTTSGDPITLEESGNTLPESITTNSAADVEAPLTPSGTTPTDGSEVTPPGTTTPPILTTVPNAGPLEVTPPESLSPEVPPITTAASPLEVTPPDSWKPAPGASVDPLQCQANFLIEPLCGGGPPPPSVTPPVTPPDDNDGSGSNDGDGQDGTTGGDGETTPTENPNSNDDAEQDAYDKAYDDLSHVDKTLTKDDIEDHIEAQLEFAKKVMKGLVGDNYELSPKEKILIYQGISDYAKQEGRTGEDIKKTTKALKETPVEAILPTVGPLVGGSTPSDAAFGATLGLGVGVSAADAAFGRTLAFAGGAATADGPIIPIGDLIALGAVLGGAAIWLVANQMSDNGDVSDTNPQTSPDDTSNGESNPYDEPPLPEYPAGWDGKTPPAEGWEWRGKPGTKPGDPEGSWYDPQKKQYLRPSGPEDTSVHGPHIDWGIRGAPGKGARWYPDGTIENKPW